MKNNSSTYTQWIVRDALDRRYLNAPTYTGRRRAAWGRIGEAHVFSSPASAQACAGNINRRRSDRASGPVAEVVAVEIIRRG
jgi:hypothetical protein